MLLKRWVKTIYTNIRVIKWMTSDSKLYSSWVRKHKGYTATQKHWRDADLIIINTCSVREKPVQNFR